MNPPAENTANGPRFEQLQFEQVKKDYGLVSGWDLSAAAQTLGQPDHLVEGLLPPRSIALLVGDSGIGKSPLIYQLALSIAAGVPFAGLKTRRSRVLLVDYENTLWDSHWIMNQQRKFLGLPAFPGNFLLWPQSLGPASGMHREFERVIERLGPELIILDSLRSFDPKMETDNTTTARQIKWLRQTACRCGASVLFVHHLRKYASRRIAPLERERTLDWLLQSSGSRALINQSDARIAVSQASPAPAAAGAALVLRAQLRTRGETGPYYLRRRLDAAGQPLGYDRIESMAHVWETPEQEELYNRLPENFMFKQACQISGRNRDTTNHYLHKLIELGLLRKIAFGQYRKLGGLQAA